jgi:hypothetical protein
MEDMQKQMADILGNPEMMQTIMNMAQQLSQPSPEPEITATEKPPSPLPDMDINMLKQLGAIAQKTSVDKNQQTLLSALAPYLTQGRLQKLEKAMRAAKLAGIASAFLSSPVSPFHLGR